MHGLLAWLAVSNDIKEVLRNIFGGGVYKVLIIGTGFGGISAAIGLIKQRITDFVMLERRAFMGGTWMQNRYPGAQVDVQSPLYSLVDEPEPWTQMFAEQPELEAYTNRVIDKYGLREKAILQANVVRLKWQDADCFWRVECADGRHFDAQSVICAQGPLSQPVVPDFAGRDSFAGQSFHTNDWPQDFDHRGKRVAIIGSGASAAQVIPAIAADVAELHVFQRTPHWVLPRPDRIFSPLTRHLMGVRLFYNIIRRSIYWGLEWRIFAFKYWHGLLRFFAERPARKHLREKVSDPFLRGQLTPDYMIGCKRIIVSNNLYPALDRDNVTLHDKNDAIKSITPKGITTIKGTELELDTIIYATGFDATDNNLGFTIEGREGHRLKDFWRAYPRAYMGTCVPGFPNLFLVMGPNTGIGHTSAIFIIESQMQYIMRALRELHQKKGQTLFIEVTEEAEQAYTENIHQQMQKTVWHSGGCNSWYKHKSGRVIAMYPGFSFYFRWLAKRFKKHHHRIVRTHS